MNEDLKIDPNLKANLEIPESELEKVGVNENDFWEVIVKYNGDLNEIKDDLDLEIEILSSNYAILTLKRSDIYLLSKYRQIEYIEKPKLLTFSLNTSLANSCINPVKNAPNDLKGSGTIVAIIDSGINYTHKDFLNPDGTTRILYIWDQTIEGNPPEGFLGGSVYTKEDIDNALKSTNPLDLVPHIDYVGHGTAVAGIAASNGSSSNGTYQGVASESSLIIVKLGERGRESFARSTEIMRAIKFILDKSIELNMPVAINLSFGTNDGSHTGESLFETYIDDMCNIWKTSICVATGNEGSTAHHYKNIVGNNEEITIEVSVYSNVSSLAIVLYKNFVDTFDIKVIAPNNRDTGFINSSILSGEYNFSDSMLYFTWGQPVPYTLDQGVFFDIFSLNGQYVPNGLWRIIIRGVDIVDGDFDLWLPVTEIASRNIKFLNPSPLTTLTIPSTAKNVISVGAYNSLTNSIADFSGRGFTRNGMIKPDIVAPGVNIRTTSNVGSGYDSLTGTSMAAPFVTGACALMMQWGIVNGNDLFLYGERLKAFLRLGANRKSNLNYPDQEWGYGSLCLLETLNYLKSTSSLNINKLSIENEKKPYSIAEYSEDYIARVAEDNIETRRIIQEYDFVKVCRALTGGLIILYIQEDKMDLLTQDEINKMSLQTISSILGLMDTQALEASGVLAVQNQPFLNLRGNGVLVGIIDTGINYTLDEFKYEDNTSKIVNIWDQSIEGAPPEGQCFGTEFTREQINQAINSENPFDIVPSTDENGHGTRISSVLAGRQVEGKKFIGVAPDSELLVVKLKQASNTLKDYHFVDRSIDAYDSVDLMLAIEYLYEKSLILKKPLSIYIGIGTNYGAHTGNSILEQYISNIAIKNAIAISICSGNEGNAAHHAMVKLIELNVERPIELRIGENEKGFLLTIVGYISDRIGVNIVSPSGEATGRIPVRANYKQEIFLPLNNTRIQVEHSVNSSENTGQVTLITFKNPSPGVWSVNLYGENILIGDVHAWLPISNFITKDTYFLNPDPFYTVTIPSTSTPIISVGGYNSIDNSFFIDSGRGPNRLNLFRPILCAPAVNVSCVGVNGDIETISGTSVATSIVAGCAALLLEWGIIKGNEPNMNSITIIGFLANGTKKVPNQMFPNNLWGFGILDILGTFENL